MKDLLKEPIQQRIFILVAIFLTAFAVIILTDRVLCHYTSRYISSINSQHSRSVLGKILIRNLIQIEKDIYGISGDIPPASIKVVEKQLLFSLNDIELILDTLQHGGEYTHALDVNMENIDEINETISFTIKTSQGYNIEVLNLSPKILDIKENVSDLIDTKTALLRAINDNDRLSLGRNFSIQLKQTDTLLRRSKENAARIFYDTNQAIQQLEQRFNKSTKLFAIIQVTEVIVALIIIFASFLTISRQIQTIVKERHRMAETLQKLNDELELRIEERTANLIELNTTLENEIGERKKAEERLKYLSYVDGLTEISNRRYFDEYFNKEWNRAARNSVSLSLIMIDIDFFKNYNDVYGHPKGDECLKKIAGVVQMSIRRTGDFVARYGGEELIVVLPDTDIKGASHIAETIRANVEAATIEHNKSSVAKAVTVSLGVASATPQRGADSSALIAETDRCLYRAKQEGRNRVVIQQ